MPPAKSILVVDDDQNLRQSLAMVLQNAGYEVFSAKNAQECLLSLQRRRYDMMVLDHRMPDMNGMTLLTAVRQAYPDLKVFFLTGSESTDLEKEAWEKGVKGYLVKPANLEKVLSVVHSICPLDSFN